MSLLVPSSSARDREGVVYSGALEFHAAHLNHQLTLQNADVNVHEVALQRVEDDPAYVDVVITYEADGNMYTYRVPVLCSVLKNATDFDRVMESVLQDINDNVTKILPFVRTLKLTRKCHVVVTWEESNKLDVFVRVHLNKKESVEKTFTYDRHAFVSAYKEKRMKSTLFGQIVLFIGEGARHAFVDAFAKPTMKGKAAPPPRGTKRRRIHHGEIKIPKRERVKKI